MPDHNHAEAFAQETHTDEDTWFRQYEDLAASFDQLLTDLETLLRGNDDPYTLADPLTAGIDRVRTLTSNVERLVADRAAAVNAATQADRGEITPDYALALIRHQHQSPPPVVADTRCPIEYLFIVQAKGRAPEICSVEDLEDHLYAIAAGATHPLAVRAWLWHPYQVPERVLVRRVPASQLPSQYAHLPFWWTVKDTHGEIYATYPAMTVADIVGTAERQGAILHDARRAAPDAPAGPYGGYREWRRAVLAAAGETHTFENDRCVPLLAPRGGENQGDDEQRGQAVRP